MNRVLLRHLLLVMALSSCAAPGAEPLPVGSVIGASLLPPGPDTVNLIWVLQPADYVRCETQARAIRRLQRSSDAWVPLTVVAVGGGEKWLHEFMARERLRGRVRSFTPASFRSTFGRSPSSALYVVAGTRVVSAFPVGGVGADVPRELSRAVGRFVEEVEPASVGSGSL